MTLNLTVPQQSHTDFTPRITVIGVGGGGTNAVDNMIAMNLQGVEFVVANTDAQQLVHSRADRRIQLGPHITQGLGAGAKPEIGRAAAEEAAEELYRHLDGVHMVFITAGMGGGTGTGAAPVIARMARERNILTVGVVTKPFTFEGGRRAKAADAGIDELQQYVDTLIVIPNQNLFRLANDRTGFKEAFKMADNVLYMGVRGVTDLMVAPGLINLDFADIRTVMAEMGKAMMGTGEAEGENRSVRAAEAAINNPLLEDTSMAGARGLLINITGGEDMTLFEVDEAANRIRQEVDEGANIIFGTAVDESLLGKIRVSVVATGIDTPSSRTAQRPQLATLDGVAASAAAAAPLAPAAHDPMPRGLPMGVTMGSAAVAMQPGVSTGLRPAAAPPAARVAPPQPRMHAQVTPQAVVPPQTQPYGLAQPQRPAPVADAELQEAAFETGYADPVRPIQQRPQPAASAQPPRTGTSRFAGEPRIPGRDNGLFAAEPAAPPAQIGRNLFNRMTNAFHRDPPSAPKQPEPQQYVEPRTAATRHDTAQASHRQPGQDEPGIEIPAFLRRQGNP